MTHVLFWDIDGTLLSTGRAGILALEDAAREVLGEEVSYDQMFTSGLTDSEVSALAIRSIGRTDEPELVARFLRVYEERLPGRLPEREGHVKPHVSEILDALDGRRDVVNLLLTGNTRAGAKAKLTHYGLVRHFADGAFCAEGDDRPTIARRAWELALAQAGGDLDPESVYVIGDTPHDVAAGKAIGVRTVAVATGQHTLEELEATQPWLALAELPEPERFAELLGLPR